MLDTEITKTHQILDTARFEGVNATPIRNELPSCKYETASSDADKMQLARDTGHGMGELTSISFEKALDINLRKDATALSHAHKHLAKDTEYEKGHVTLKSIETSPSIGSTRNTTALQHACTTVFWNP